MVNTIISFLSGKKTFIVGILTIVLGLLNGDNALVLQGLSVMTLRSAISKVS